MSGLAFRASRSHLAGAVVRTGFAVAPGLLPLDTIERRDSVLLCRHPRPSFGSWHHLLVPLAPVADLFALAHPRRADLRGELFAMLDQVDPRPFVVVNAGPRQDVGQVHFHITDDLPAVFLVPAAGSWTDWDTAVRALAAVPDIATKFYKGFSLVQNASEPGVHLVSS